MMPKSEVETIFLGPGRVATSMACFMGGKKRAFDEKSGELQEYTFDDQSKKWVFVSSCRGSFDEMDWTNKKGPSVVVSPGVSSLRPFVEKIKEREIRELDLFCENFQGEIVVITGTNGKSSLTNQLGYLLKKHFGEQAVFVGGNLDPASFDLFQMKPLPKIAVLEVSSYQAERLKTAQFDLGLLTNLGPDHFDRYRSQQNYYQAKWSLLKRCETLIYPESYSFEKASAVSLGEKLNSIEYLQKISGFLKDRWGVELDQFNFDELPRLRHRLEMKTLASGVSLIDDSKATNVHAVAYAIQQLRQANRSFKWILGGQLKGDSFQALQDSFSEEDQLFIYGPGKDQIVSELRASKAKLFKYESLKSLLAEQKPLLVRGDFLVLSPGGASFGEFSNYAERGDFFLQFFE